MGLPKLWIHHLRLAHHFTNSPVSGLSDRAFRAHVEALLFLAQMRAVDGFIHDVQVPRAIGLRRKRTWQQLVDAGLWVPVEGGYYAFGWDDYNNQSFKIAPGAIDIRTREPIPEELRDDVYWRDGHQCLICGAIDNLSLDHIVPHSMGGEDTLENLRTLCRSCNSRRGAARYTDDQIRGLA